MTIRRMVAAALASAALSSTALSADLPYRRSAPPQLVAVPAAFTWTGFYVGANVGGIVTDPGFALGPGPSFGATPSFATARITRDRTAVIGGVQTGYNYQIGSFVFGEESDVNLLNVRDRGSASAAAGAPYPAGSIFNARLRSRIDGLSTHRLRVGFTPFERLLIYGTAGIASADIRNTATVTVPAANGVGPVYYGRDSAYRAGFVAGGGVEYALTNTTSLKAEYLHVDLGRESFPAVPVLGTPSTLTFQNRARTSFDVGRVGLNVRFDTVTALIPTVAGYVGLSNFPLKAAGGAHDWTGFHIGAFGGGIRDRSALLIGSDATRWRESSGFGGIEAGYSKQFGSLVVGSESDYGWLDLSERRRFGPTVNGTIAATGSARHRVDDLATFRSRVGVTVFDSFLVYGTAGLAVADIRNTAGFTVTNGLGQAGDVSGTKSTLRAGLAYGGGIEYALSTNLSVKAEYLRADLRHQNFVLQPGTAAAVTAGVLVPARDTAKFDLGRIGVNYRFATPDSFLGVF